MYPRINYEMTQQELDELLESFKAVPVMMIGSYAPSSQQENANRAWARLGEKLGFDYMTVQPISGKGDRFFSAVPSENETQREERIIKEKEIKRLAEIATINTEIGLLQNKLRILIDKDRE